MSVDYRYHVFSQKQADENWPYLVEDLRYVRDNRKSYFNDELELNQRQENFRKLVFSLIEEDKSSESGIKSGLIDVDLAYGLVESCDDFEDMPESVILEVIMNYYGLPREGSFISGKEIVGIFPIKKEEIAVMVEELRKIYDWDEEETEEGLRDYIQVIAPGVRALRDVDDAVMIREGGGTYEPESIYQILQQRAEQHYKEYGQRLFDDLGIIKLPD